MGGSGRNPTQKEVKERIRDRTTGATASGEPSSDKSSQARAVVTSRLKELKLGTFTLLRKVRLH